MKTLSIRFLICASLVMTFGVAPLVHAEAEGGQAEGAAMERAREARLRASCQNNLKQFGFGESDFANGGSDALVDALLESVGGVRCVDASEAAARAGTVETFVLISSLAAGGPASLDDPRDETHEDRPITGYGRSKRDAEDLLAGDWPFRTVILRPPSLYGPRDREFRPLLRAARAALVRGFLIRCASSNTMRSGLQACISSRSRRTCRPARSRSGT